MNYSISKVYFSHKTTNYCTFLVQITFWVGSVILPTRTGMWFFLSWTMKINGRFTTTSFCSPKAAEKRAISTPVAAAPSVPSFVTWAKLGQVGQQQQQLIDGTLYDKRPPQGTCAWSCSLRLVHLKFPPTQPPGWTPASRNLEILNCAN